MLSISASLLLLSLATTVLSATADEWRSQSVYQLLTDRYANDSPDAPCNDDDRTWCGGTWKSIMSNLDYIQSMGFTAIWISPVNKNLDSGRTPYGDPYHAYWVTDITKLNDKFGTADDLKALSKAVHDRGMLLMVDIVINHVATTSQHPTDFSPYFFKEESQYHPYCPIEWGNEESEQQCWMGDEKVALMDVNTEDESVVNAYLEWIGPFVREYGIDGMRLDAARHVREEFWPPFCEAAGVFCMGEVFEQDSVKASVWQGPMESILNFPLYKGLLDAFTIPGPANISALESAIKSNDEHFGDVGLLGNFLENHDVPRWANVSVDPQSLYNAMSFIFMTDGIPIVYFGQEQGKRGAADPYNREALWPSKYANTTAVELIRKLNTLRSWMIESDPGYLMEPSKVLGTTENAIIVQKGHVISVLTNIGSPPQNISVPVYTPYERSVPTTDVLTCTQFAVGSSGTVSVQYSLGGRPVILVPNSYLKGSGLCEIREGSFTGLRPNSATSAVRMSSSELARTLFVVLGLVLGTFWVV